jgi:AbrB family looped-hinge helix DNA binding protein
MPSTRVGRRGQLTIPKAVRQSLGLVEGDRVAFVERGGEVVLRPVRQSLRDLRGSVPVEGPQDFDAVREAVRHDRADRLSSAAPSGATPSAAPDAD